MPTQTRYREWLSQADPDGVVAEAFGLDTGDGRTDRWTFVLVDREVFATYNPELADPAGHAREVLNDIRNEFITGGTPVSNNCP